MKVLIVNSSDTQGGAARAAFRLSSFFQEKNIISRILVRKKSGHSHFAISLSRRLDKVWFILGSQLGHFISNFERTSKSTTRSVNLIPSRIFHRIQSTNADIVNLHWVNEETISVCQIGRILKPTIFTLHDMWAFCGSEHYTEDRPDARFRSGYHRANREPGSTRIDIDRWTWKRKKKHWSQPRHVICPSHWLAQCAGESDLMREWPIHVIPNVLDTNCFKPMDKAFCRKALGLTVGKRYIAYGAIGGASDPRKGFALLQKALQELMAGSSKAELEAVVFGQSQPAVRPELGLPINYMGHLHDDFSLALLYNAVDVMVVPSLQENLPQTGTEAQSCGTPVVAFNTTGLPDVVVHAATGYLAEPFSPEDLAAGIAWVLEDSERYQQLSLAARERAVRLWSPEVVIPQYLEVYQRAIDEHQR
ncbi:glycosyltransferase [Marinobacterium rhizophilum]|uniref:Glycosyltransferase n=1 Tax=Marinobacterium rhizophilum TaxID=420402 RepID=A0ABY5HPM3_9GAMM|nr:glycosyltransferase [Marinobacterium rhizophilum]UTW14258.1 glycosyltransferase [Marinobacterium rhizophilum]